MKRVETLFFVLPFVAIHCLADANKEALLAVTRGNKLFTSKFYDVIRKDIKGNLVASPLSVATAAAMLQAGARGETAQAIRSSFSFPPDDQLNPGYKSLLKELQSEGNITLEMVNRIYPADGFQLNSQFSGTLKIYFDAEPHQLNYAQSTHAAGEINSFVSGATHGKIRDLVDARDLDVRTKLVLINAIYFKGNWKYQFPKNATTKEDFYTSETNAIKVDMMSLETGLLAGEIPALDATVVALPYDGGRWNMIILLPNNRSGLSEMENKLKELHLDEMMSNLKKQKVKLHLPRFKLESTIDLKKPLTELGAGGIFKEGEADFHGISDTPSFNLFVSKAVQKAFIEVNEEGTEATAATSITIKNRTKPRPTLVVRVDHPFYAMIVHGEIGVDNGPLTPVFVQRVTHI